MIDQLLRQVEEGFFVAPQLDEASLADARHLGVRLIINNRPDGESPDQIPSERAREICAAAGLGYAHVPVAGGLNADALAAFTAAADACDGPVIAYCLSGTRSCYLWALSAARRLPPPAVVEAAARAGYDVSPLGAALEAIHAAARR